MGPYACERQNEERQSGEELFVAEQTNEARKCVIHFWEKAIIFVQVLRGIYNRGRSPAGAGSKA